MIRYIVVFLFLVNNFAFTQHIVSGKLTDINGLPLAGATIRIENTNLGTFTKSDGSYLFKINSFSKDSIILKITLIGFASISDKIYIKKTEIERNYTLIEQPLKTDEIVVSANKKIQAIQEVPISLSIIDSRAIQDRGLMKLDEALLYASGLEVNQDNVNIRGTSGFSFGVGSRVALMIDGFNMLAGDNNDIKFDALPMMNIEKIEIVKGAGSALYGTGALGGVINLITEKPKDKPTIKLNTFGGIYTKPRYEQWIYNNSQNFYSGINLSYSNKFDDFEIVAATKYIKDDSYREYEDGINIAAFTKMKYYLSDASNISLMINGTHDYKSNWVFWNSLDSATKPPTNTDKSIKIASSKISIFSDFNHIFNQDNFMIFKVGAYITEFHNSLNEGDKEYRQSQALNFNTELQFNSNITDDINLTYGINSNLINVYSKIYQQRKQYINAAYLQAEYKPFDRMIFTLGGRIDYEYLENIQSNIEYSPKFGLSYNLIDKLNLRASAGRGFRSASIAERYASLSFQGFDVLQNLELKPEISWSSEIGANYEFDWLNQFFALDISIFRNYLSNLIEPTFADKNSAKIQFVNIKEAEINGLEFNFKTFLLGHIGLETALTLMNPRDLTLNQTLNYRSEVLWYNRLFVPLGLIEFQLDYRYKQQYENYDKQLGLIIKDIDAKVDVHVVDTRLIFNLKNEINQNLKIILSSRNLLDYYYTEMIGNLAPTRMIMLQLEYQN